jgi:hypothetical protein
VYRIGNRQPKLVQETEGRVKDRKLRTMNGEETEGRVKDMKLKTMNGEETEGRV